MSFHNIKDAREPRIFFDNGGDRIIFATRVCRCFVCNSKTKIPMLNIEGNLTNSAKWICKPCLDEFFIEAHNIQKEN